MFVLGVDFILCVEAVMNLEGTMFIHHLKTNGKFLLILFPLNDWVLQNCFFFYHFVL